MMIDGQISNRVRQTLLWSYKKAQFWLGSSVRTNRIGGTSASFETKEYREFVRAEMFVKEDEMINRLIEAACPDDVFWDVGANIGTHTCFIGPGVGKTVAFEARPETAKRLRRNIELNDINADIHNIALDNCSGTVELGVPSDVDSDVGVGSFSLVRSESSTFEIAAVTADELVESGEVARPTLVKLDVEGSEKRVLEGMEKTLSECRILLCEVHPEHVEESEIREILSEYGFSSVDRLGKRGNQVHLWATI